MPNPNPQYVASGNIIMSRFVSPVIDENFTVIQATANRKIAGVSMEGTREAPIPSVTTNYAAADGESLQVHGQDEMCKLELGATVAAGDDLKSDSVGRGVAITTGATAQEVGAVALESGVLGDKIDVQVHHYSEGGTANAS